MFIHHVYFTLKNPNSIEDRDAVVAGLSAMRPIETIKMIHIGFPASTNRDVIDRSYSISWLLVFDNLTDQEVYQVHPLHKNFIETCGHLWSKVVVYDSE